MCNCRKLCDKADCQICFEKSFASHEKSKYWSDKNELTPRQVFKVSGKKYWLNCECGHEFEASLANVTRNNKLCKYCSNPSLELCNKEDCQSCFEKSFASHEKSKYWSDKNKLKSRQVFKVSGKKYWFSCDKCNHDFESSLANITKQKRWCSYCRNQKLCNNYDCQYCFKKSFASYEKSKYWSDKNELTPRQVFKSSGKKYWFNCKYSHEFISSLHDITGNNTWCPICVNKTEQKLYENLLQIYPNLNRQFRVDWCKNINTTRYLPFDFALEDRKIIIELDGPQHFVQVRNWKSPEEHFKIDKYKEKCANENGYSIVRLLQEDVLYDKYDWITELNENINKIMSEAPVKNIYMCKNNEYNTFM
jgi:very-short-patch-repair endonuclease